MKGKRDTMRIQNKLTKKEKGILKYYETVECFAMKPY